MTTAKVSQEHGQSGWIVAFGVLLILTGIGALVFPFLTTLTVEILVGCSAFVAGLITVFHAFSAKNWSGFFWELLIGALYVLTGIILLANPFGGAIALTLILGAMFVVDGILRSVLAFQIRPTTNWGWVFASGCLSIAVGILTFAGMTNGASLAFIGLLVGMNFVFAGISFIAIGTGSAALPNAKAA